MRLRGEPERFFTRPDKKFLVPTLCSAGVRCQAQQRSGALRTLSLRQSKLLGLPSPNLRLFDRNGSKFEVAAESSESLTVR